MRDWLHAPDAPTVLVYGHYDVQPVDPLDLWTSPPFEPVVVGDRMLARGAADDKGQIHAHVMAAAAILATAGRFPVNVKYLFEGEEESSSAHLDAWLDANRERVARRRGDHQRLGLLRGQSAGHHPQPARDHVRPDRRGRDRGRSPFGWLRRGRPEPGQRAGRGSSPRSRAPTAGSGSRASTTMSCRSRKTDRAALAALPFDEAEFQREAGAAGPGRRGRIHDARASLGRARRSTSTGCGAGSPGRGPRRSSRRTPMPRSAAGWWPPRSPTGSSRPCAAYVEEIAPPGVTTTVRYLGGGHPSLTAMDHPLTQAAARALEATFGAAPVYIRRVAPSRSAPAFPRSSDCRSCSSGSPHRTTTPMPPTNGWTWTTTRPASGPSRGCSRSWSTSRVDGRHRSAVWIWWVRVGDSRPSGC